MQKIQWNSSNGQLHWFLIDFLWKWSKMDQNYANANASRPLAKFLRGIQICHMKADVLAIPKMWWFLILHFFKPKLLLPKVGSNLKNFFCRIAVLKKKTRLQISISSLHMNRTWVSHGTFQVLFISEVKTQNCGRGIFFWHRLFLVTNRKFQSRLTLSAYNSASKALIIKKYHITESPGRQLSHGTPPDIWCNIKISRNWQNTKKCKILWIFIAAPPHSCRRPPLGQFWRYGPWT